MTIYYNLNFNQQSLSLVNSTLQVLKICQKLSDEILDHFIFCLIGGFNEDNRKLHLWQVMLSSYCKHIENLCPGSEKVPEMKNCEIIITGSRHGVLKNQVITWKVGDPNSIMNIPPVMLVGLFISIVKGCLEYLKTHHYRLPNQIELIDMYGDALKSTIAYLIKVTSRFCTQEINEELCILTFVDASFEIQNDKNDSIYCRPEWKPK